MLQAINNYENQRIGADLMEPLPYEDSSIPQILLEISKKEKIMQQPMDPIYQQKNQKVPATSLNTTQSKRKIRETNDSIIEATPPPYYYSEDKTGVMRLHGTESNKNNQIENENESLNNRKGHSSIEANNESNIIRQSSSSSSKSSTKKKKKRPEKLLLKMLDLNPFAERKLFKLHESAIRVLVELHPEIFRKKYTFKHCRTPTPPLSMLCALNASIPLLEDVYHIFPEALNYSSAFRMASGCGAKVKILQWLVEKDPDAVKVEHPKFGYPLHQACSNAPLEIVRFVYERFPNALRFKNKKGNTPLHCACKFSSLEVVKYLAGLDASILGLLNDKYETPVQVALCHGRKDVASFLQQKYASYLQQQQKCIQKTVDHKQQQPTTLYNNNNIQPYSTNHHNTAADNSTTATTMGLFNSAAMIAEDNNRKRQYLLAAARANEILLKNFQVQQAQSQQTQLMQFLTGNNYPYSMLNPNNNIDLLDLKTLADYQDDGQNRNNNNKRLKTS